tara:strand:+ start:75336 stop:75953 length:618 start_codon:yes stop_codon:yes gene_type:complete
VDISQILDPEKVDKLFRAKAEYGQLFLFGSDRYITVFRPFTVEEAEVLASMAERLNQCAIEDWVFRTCFVTSNESVDHFLNQGPYLYVANIAAKIPALSHIQEEGEYKKTVMLLREGSSRLQDVVETIITKAYMGYKDVKKLTQQKQFELLVRSENLTGEMLDLGDKKKTKTQLRQFTEGAEVIGGTEAITSPGVADMPDFNEQF